MSEQPNYVLACNKIGVVMYPDNQAVGLEVIDPAQQRLFISLRGSVLVKLAEQLQQFADEHPEVLSWEPAQMQD